MKIGKINYTDYSIYKYQSVYEKHVISFTHMFDSNSPLYRQIREFMLEVRFSYNVNHKGEIQNEKHGYKIPDPDRTLYAFDKKKFKKFSEEPHLCIDLYRRYKSVNHPLLGKVIDYEVPVIRSSKYPDFLDFKIGEVDLMHQIGNVVYLTEVKGKPKGDYKIKDTILRCVLEIETYFNSIDLKKLAKDFSNCELDNHFEPTDEIIFKKAIIIYKKSRASRDLMQLINKKNKYPMMREFLKGRNITIFLMENNDTYYPYEVSDVYNLSEIL